MSASDFLSKFFGTGLAFTSLLIAYGRGIIFGLGLVKLKG
jgi:hypothetical protein